MARHSSAPRHPVDEYIEGVLSGRIVTCKSVRMCVERHLRDLEEGESRGLFFDANRAQYAIDFFQHLRHSKGEWAGEPFVLEPWQQFRRWCIYGWLRRQEDGTLARRFRIGYTEVARKNGKSTEGAGDGLYLFEADEEPGAEVYTAATKFDQAKIIHSEAIRMVKRSPALSRRIRVFKNNLSIPETASKFEPLGADSKTLDGLNPHGALIDELHAHPDGDLFDVLETATGARREPLILIYTTAGYDVESICYEMHEHTLKVLEGAIEDDAFFGYIATLDKDDDWKDESVWIKANPNLGVSIKAERIREAMQRAEESLARLNTFLRLRMNVWTQQKQRWINMEKWTECGGAIDFDALAGHSCYAGLDLSSNIDITALVLAFPLDDGRIPLLCRFWIPEERAAERQRKDRVPYLMWEREGYVSFTPGNVIDLEFIRAELNELNDRFAIHEIAIDRWQSTKITTSLTDDGFTVVPFGQGMGSMSPASKAFEELLLTGKLQHGDNPVLKWMAANVAVKTDPAGNIKPVKPESPNNPKKIDGVVASIMAVARATVNEGSGRPSIWFVG